MENFSTPLCLSNKQMKGREERKKRGKNPRKDTREGESLAVRVTVHCGTRRFLKISY